MQIEAVQFRFGSCTASAFFYFALFGAVALVAAFPDVVVQTLVLGVPRNLNLTSTAQKMTPRNLDLTPRKRK